MYFHSYNEEAMSRMLFLPKILFLCSTHQLKTTVNVHTQLTLWRILGAICGIGELVKNTTLQDLQMKVCKSPCSFARNTPSLAEHEATQIS